MPHAICILVVLGVYTLDGSGVLGGFMENTYPASVIEDAHLNTVS